MLLNISKLPHILDVKGQAFPTTIYPGMVFDPSSLGSYDTSAFKEFVMSEDLPKYKAITCLRRYALGDVIQLIPVVRILRDTYKYKNVYILTSYEHFRTLKFLFPDILFGEHRTLDSGMQERFGIVVNLDGVLEKDHSAKNSENSMHRIHIYLKFFGLQVPDDVVKKQWNAVVKITKEIESLGLDMNKKRIALQIRGSGCIKTLPKDYIISLANTLAAKYQVVLLDHDRNQGFEGNNILNLCGKLNTYEVVATLTKVSACITMDSGMLWLAHCANCPVVTILGPTREHERLSLHPGYPILAKSINISEEIIKCKPCFETREYCKGKINCMNYFDRDILTNKIIQKLNSILEHTNGEKTTSQSTAS
jgi:ADP-heptose:LPS heptosyltransferase